MSGAFDGYAIAIGNCFTCHRRFGFNPHRVPSHEGQPVCQDCFDDWNRRRVAEGLEPVDALPGAYDPLPADELIFD